MASEAPSWADQWGAGGIGVIEEEDNKAKKDGKSDDKKDSKGAGFGKAKAAAVAGAQKIKNGTSTGIKWLKSHCQKNPSSK